MSLFNIKKISNRTFKESSEHSIRIKVNVTCSSDEHFPTSTDAAYVSAKKHNFQQNTSTLAYTISPPFSCTLHQKKIKKKISNFINPSFKNNHKIIDNI